MSVSKSSLSFAICSALVGVTYLLGKTMEHTERSRINPNRRKNHKDNTISINNQTISITRGDTEYFWIVPNLWKFVEHKKVTQWSVPDSLLDQWTWGDSQPAEHLERVLKADLKYPVIVYNGRILDGNHRTIKSLALGKKSVNAVVLSEMPPYDFSYPAQPLDNIKKRSGLQPTLRDMVRISKEAMRLK